MLGTDAAQVAVTDLAVDRATRNSFVSVMRGQGPAARPALLRVDGAGAISADRHRSAPVHQRRRCRTCRAERRPDATSAHQSITQVDVRQRPRLGERLVEREFASKLWSIAYPFTKADAGHERRDLPRQPPAARDARADVRVRAVHDRQPAVHHRRLPVHAAREVPGLCALDTPAAKPYRGTTIAEFGAGNRPIDMVLYKKNGKDFLLMSNTNRGVMKIPDRRLRDRRADHHAGDERNRRRAVREGSGDGRRPCSSICSMRRTRSCSQAPTRR